LLSFFLFQNYLKAPD